MTHTIPLPGCTPEPLMNYLKALGIFRLISEQADPHARAAWRSGTLILQTHLTEPQLIDHLHSAYQPSPFFSPWNGDGGFLSETGTSAETIARIEASTAPRLAPLREAIQKIRSMAILTEFATCRARAKELDKRKKAKSASDAELEELKEVTKRTKTLKDTILSQIRTDFPDSSLGWFDTCLQVGDDGFSVAPALGSGGVDGRMEFSANFLSNLLLVLNHPDSPAWIESSLFARGNAPLAPLSIGQFSPGHIGGPNATQGFEGSSALNPWDYILMIEGTPLLAGAVSRRCRTAQFARAAFPFTVLPTAQDSDSVEAKDSNSARGELWLPLWPKLLSLAELRQLFGEGRAEWGGAQSRTSVDFAKAVASFGVDRGIASFSRHGFLQRNGLAFLATPLGRFDVRSRDHVHLLREADPWIERFRRACTDKTPARFTTALRRIDSAVFDYCRFGGTDRFQAILIALGHAERQLANARKFRESVHPLARLSADWVTAADDGTPEFQIAVALAGIRGVSPGHPLGLRANLEPIERPQKGGLAWLPDSPAVVWNRADPVANLTAVLARRLLDTERLSLPHLPIASPRTVHPDTVAAFLAGTLDEPKIEALLWGLITCRIDWQPTYLPESLRTDPPPPLPRAYCLLKPLFSGLTPDTPPPTNLEPAQFTLFENLRRLQPDPRILALLTSGRLEEALTLATQRLRNADLPVARIDWPRTPNPIPPNRLAAALLLPASPSSLLSITHCISRKETPDPTTA